MRESSIININSKNDLDTPIYRVYNHQRLLSMFESQKNTLVKPELWDDPLENFILQAAAKRFENSHQYDFRARKMFFGQCWSLHEESDAMWRIYSHDKMGVKVKTTIRKLFNSLLNSPEADNGFCYIGKVKYLESELLKQKLHDAEWLISEVESYEGQATSLLFKRLEFTHEQEIRLLYLDRRHSYENNLYSYSIDPMDLFDEIQFDPRIPAETYNVFHFYLSDKIGYKKKISQSELYKVPHLEF